MNTKDTFNVGDKVELAGIRGVIIDTPTSVHTSANFNIKWDEIGFGLGCDRISSNSPLFQQLKKVETTIQERFPIGAEIEVTIRGKVMKIIDAYSNQYPIAILQDGDDDYIWPHIDFIANAKVISKPE